MPEGGLDNPVGQASSNRRWTCRLDLSISPAVNDIFAGQGPPTDGQPDGQRLDSQVGQPWLYLDSQGVQLTCPSVDLKETWTLRRPATVAIHGRRRARDRFDLPSSPAGDVLKLPIACDECGDAVPSGTGLFCWCGAITHPECKQEHETQSHVTTVQVENRELAPKELACVTCGKATRSSCWRKGCTTPVHVADDCRSVHLAASHPPVPRRRPIDGRLDN